MSDVEQLGKFYLGREHDLATGHTRAEPLLYDSKDLTTHAVCVGMTGSGKTGLCVSLLEEAALDGVPAIVIDPKGDLGNLLLTFPNLEAADFRPWIDERAAAREQMSPDEFASKRADLWRNGLAEWGQAGDTIYEFSGGFPREINILAGQAMLNAYLEDKHAVSRTHVVLAKADYGFEGVHRRRPHESH